MGIVSIMIRTVEEVRFEKKVIEREGRFIDGLQWHLSDLLQQLQREERMLIARASGGTALGAAYPEALWANTEQLALANGEGGSSASDSEAPYVAKPSSAIEELEADNVRPSKKLRLELGPPTFREVLPSPDVQCDSDGNKSGV